MAIFLGLSRLRTNSLISDSTWRHYLCIPKNIFLDRAKDTLVCVGTVAKGLKKYKAAKTESEPFLARVGKTLRSYVTLK